MKVMGMDTTNNRIDTIIIRENSMELIMGFADGIELPLQEPWLQLILLSS